MKTTDLIPIILYQLVDSDKYGYEIIKQIESVSNGSITIKQPSLYSILKKLEQGKFISSYWQDSEIGGKRHYYKLTDNGRAQLDTYPPLEELIKEEQPTTLSTMKQEVSALDNDVSSFIPSPVVHSEDEIVVTPSTINLQLEQPIAQFEYGDESSSSINERLVIDVDGFKHEVEPTNQEDYYNKSNDFIENNIEFKPVDMPEESLTFSPNVEVSAEDNLISNSFVTNIDSTEHLQVNSVYSEDSSDKSDPSAVQSNNEDDKTARALVDKVDPVYVATDNKLQSKISTISDDLFNTEVKEPTYDPVTINNVEQIKYINYVDFATDKSTIKRRRALKLHIIKMLMTCSTLIVMILASVIVASNYGYNPLFYLSVGMASLVVAFYPIILLYRRLGLKFKYSTKVFKYQPLTDFLIKFTAFLILGILIFAYNLKSLNNINMILSTSNLTNLWVPIVFSVCILIDFLYSFILYRPYSSKK